MIDVIARGLFGRTGYARSERANVSPLFALLLVPLIGMLGLTAETSSWIFTKRAMQNAADSAALAAAANGTTTTSGSCTSGVTTLTYECEARLVTAKYGYTNGANNVTVATAIVSCPTGDTVASGCYQVTITKNITISLLRVVGFNGNVAMGTGRGQQVIATAIANPSSVATTFCFISLGTGNIDGFRSNGGQHADLHGCAIASNADATCNGGDIGADYLLLLGSVAANKNCATKTPIQLPSAVSDLYAPLAGSIPSNTCANPGAKATYQTPETISAGSYVWPATKVVCGDLKLTGDVNITSAAPGTVLVIENGNLNLNGFTLKTLAGSGLTVIFTGPTISGFSPTHVPSANGTLDIAAPTTGTWSGVALYQDPSLTSGVDFTASGNDPTWNITGLVYFPKANVDISGSVNKASNGYACFSMVEYKFLSNGSLNFFPSGDSQSQCAQAGLIQPTGTIPGRTKLVS